MKKKGGAEEVGEFELQEGQLFMEVTATAIDENII